MKENYDHNEYKKVAPDPGVVNEKSNSNNYRNYTPKIMTKIIKP